jgi:deoxyribodipyrimidine photo-lyase
MPTTADRAVPEERVRSSTGSIRTNARFVLYWMTASRRSGWNFGLQRAVNLALELGKPLMVLEALRCDYPWASDRTHGFVIDGMRDNARAFEGKPVLYRSYVEPAPGAGRGLVEGLADEACAVVTDDFPSFFLPRMVDAVESRLAVRLERVDSNGIFPMRATDRVFTVAHSFRRFLQKELEPHLGRGPLPDPLAGVELPLLPGTPASADDRLRASHDGVDLAALPLDHAIGSTPLRGGQRAAEARLDEFLTLRLARYTEDRNHPDRDGASGFSPYLHFGHLSAHHVFARLTEREDWTIDRLGPVTGSREGWWGMSGAAEAFLDQLVTWRELGYNRCALTDDYDRYESLPEWARATLEVHEEDPRPHLYSLDELAASETADEVWNAAQTQLRREGRLHNYLRMLWGKRILEWTPTPREALSAMIELNNRYALDGRNPNSYSGIFWVLGRYDRAWGPERPIFGKVRYMSSANTARKVRLREYLTRYGP